MTTTCTVPAPQRSPRNGGVPRTFVTRYTLTLAGLLVIAALPLAVWSLVSDSPRALAHPWPAAVVAAAGWAFLAGAWLRWRGWRPGVTHVAAWVVPAVLLGPLAAPGWLDPAGLVLWAPVTTVLVAALVMAGRPTAR